MNSTTKNQRWTSLELELYNGCPSHTLKTPLRKPSANDLTSSQFNSSMNSSGISGITCNSFGISIVQEQPKNNLLRYTNMVESFGSTTNQNNFIWISSPTSSSLNSNSNNNSNSKKRTKSASSSSSSRLSDNQRRWLATATTEKARDQPICMIRRNSSTHLFPVGSPVSA
jgi:hypothetical protein